VNVLAGLRKLLGLERKPHFCIRCEWGRGIKSFRCVNHVAVEAAGFVRSEWVAREYLTADLACRRRRCEFFVER
jgi:hypothetical protein